MAKSKRDIQASSFQLMYEKILRIGVFIICLFHLSATPLRYAFNYLKIQPYMLWYGFVLLLAALFYLILTAVRYPNTWYRVSELFRRLASCELFLLIGIIIWAVLSCRYYQSITGGRYLRAHDWFFFDTSICVFLMFPMAKYLGEEKARRTIELMIHVTAGLFTIYTAWCLWNVFHLNIVTLPSGGQIGMTKATQLWLGCHYNITGAVALTMMAVCLYMAFRQQKVLKILYIIAVLLQLVVVMLCNSRTVLVAGMVLTAAASFMYTWNRFSDQESAFRIVISAVVALICTGIFYSLRSLAFLMFENITHFKELLGSSKSISEDVRELNNMSGRLNIWKASLKVMFYSPRNFFMGVTFANTTEALMKIGGITFQVAHAHNAILQVGVAFGVPAMIMFIVFLVLIFLKSIQILFKKNEQLFKHAYMVPIVVLCLVVTNLAEAYFFSTSIMNCVFFLFSGWSYALGGKN